MTSSTRRAVLCADGNVHLAYFDCRDGAAAVDTADRYALLIGACGGAPHYLAEQTTTVSPWVRVEEHNKGEK